MCCVWIARFAILVDLVLAGLQVGWLVVELSCC